MNPRQRPPYGTQVAAILRDPHRLVKFSGCTRNRGTVWASTGRDAWEFHRRHPNHLVLVLPADSDPASFNWRFLCGHEPILLIGESAEDRNRRRQIAAAMFRDGVRKVLASHVLMVAEPTKRATA